MYTRESLETLRQMLDPKDVLVQIGGISIGDIMENGDELRCPCPLHAGDNRTGFSWKKSRGYWTCFTRGCGDSHSHDIFGFVSAKMGIPFNKAAEVLAGLIGFNLEKGIGTGTNTDFLNTSALIKEHLARGRFTVQKLKQLSKLPGYDEPGFETVLKYLETRRYIYDSVKLFNFYPMIDTYGMERMGIPVYDQDNKLVGVNARLMEGLIEYPEEITLEDGTVVGVPKYRMTPFQKGSILYNLNNAKKESLKRGIILVEGQLDVTRLYTYGYGNAVCTMGTSLTAQQTALLYGNCYQTTFLVEEGDAAAVGVIKSIKQLKSGMKILIAKLPSGDADSNKKEIVVSALESATQIPLNVLAAICEEKDHDECRKLLQI